MSQDRNVVHSLQVRIPKELFDALRHVAGLKNTSLNAEVVESLQNTYPPVSTVDQAIYNGLGVCALSKERLDEKLQEYVYQYEQHVDSEITLLLSLVQLRLGQRSNAAAILSQVRSKVPVELPPEEGNDVPKKIGRPKGVMDFLSYRHTKEIKQTDEKVREITKLISRARMNALTDWNYVEDALNRIKECSSGDRDGSEA